MKHEEVMKQLKDRHIELSMDLARAVIRNDLDLAKRLSNRVERQEKLIKWSEMQA